MCGKFKALEAHVMSVSAHAMSVSAFEYNQGLPLRITNVSKFHEPTLPEKLSH